MVEPRDRTEAAEEPLVIYLHPNEDRPANPKHLVTVRGLGYKFSV